MLLAVFTFSFSAGEVEEGRTQKLIVSSHKDMISTENDLLKLKVYFHENLTTRSLKEQYHFTFFIETYEAYEAVVISPIDTLVLRNELLVLLAPIFPDIFYIYTMKNKINMIRTRVPISRNTNSNVALAVKVETALLGLEWLAIGLLAVIGLILSIKNRRKMGKLDSTQREIEDNQKKMEREIKVLGEKNA